jgi:type VI protein secretion system component VasF
MEPGILAISGNIHPYVQALEKLLRLALRWFRMVHNAQMQEMPQKTLLDIQPMSANVSTRGLNTQDATPTSPDQSQA